MQADDPPFLSVGTAVSAKYKGAFCEAKVNKVVKNVKCKVTYKMGGLGTATVSDEQVKGTVRVGQVVQVKHLERKEYLEATIQKIQDCSQYTVVFDDGDITTLRRTALCLKSGRHFNESETLDQLPLTHPEHFGNPVMGGRRGRRSRQLKEDSSEGEEVEENEPDLEQYSTEAGRVVSVEASDKKRGKDNWFPGLIVMPSAQPTVRINVKDEFLIRSFKDGRYYTVPKKEVSKFDREKSVESSVLSEAVEKAVKYLDNDELPVHWERNSLFSLQSQYSDSDENCSDTSDDEPTEEKDHFVAQLYKFMDDSGTPLNKTPMISNKDVDFYRLFKLVQKLGGYNRTTNQNKWKSVTAHLRFTQNQSTYNQVKLVYKKCLLSYESFDRTLGVTMLNHTRNAKKNRGRALIRDKDRATPVQSPRPEKEEEIEKPEPKKEEEIKPKSKKVEKKEEKKIVVVEEETTDSQFEMPSSSKQNRRREPKKTVPVVTPKQPVVPEKLPEEIKEEKEEKTQQTRSKSQYTRALEVVSPNDGKRETKTPVKETPVKLIPKPSTSKKAQLEEEKEKDKKRGRKRLNTDDKTSNSDSSVNEATTEIAPELLAANIGDKLRVFYGPTHDAKVTYEAKVTALRQEPNGEIAYFVHYTGWNSRYDEWIMEHRIAENTSVAKAKRLKQGNSANKGGNKNPTKRGRGMSITGRSTVQETPRSTTPSSITSTSSRTKSPATPASSRNTNRVTRQGDGNRRTRRMSVQTDASIHSESETDERSESDTEPSRTRTSVKGEDSEPKVYKKKFTKTKGEKRKEDEDTEKEEEHEKPKRTKKLKKLAEVKSLDDSDDETIVQPKGREFDLNQIRSELKGFGKAIKVASDVNEKDALSSDDSNNHTDNKETDMEIEEPPEPKKDTIEKSSSSDDIYEFKEPEPFEFETRKIADDKTKKRRLYENIEKTPPKKKSPRSPARTEMKEEVEKKRFKRNILKKTEELIEPEKPEENTEDKDSEDPFDKLVESPSFHIGKVTIEKSLVEKENVTKVLNVDTLFELSQSLDDNTDYSVELSENNVPPELTFTRDSTLLLDEEESFQKGDDDKRDSEDDETIRASIQSVIDNDSSDTLLKIDETVPLTEIKSFAASITTTLNRVESEDDVNEEILEETVPDKLSTLSKQLAPVFQETDKTFLETLCASPPQFSTNKLDEFKDIPVKSGTKIADTILQKFSLNKTKENKEFKEVKEFNNEFKEVSEFKEVNEFKEVTGIKEDIKEIKEEKVDLVVEVKEDEIVKEVEEEEDEDEDEKKLEIELPDDFLKEDVKDEIEEVTKVESVEADEKKRIRKYIDDSESDSDSDSEQRLVIARSDEDSQTNISFENKDVKESDSNTFNPQIEDSQSQEEERNFNFESIKAAEILKEEAAAAVAVAGTSESVQEIKMVVDESKREEEVKEEEIEEKDEEPDSHLHTMLLCEETIPGSPAPAPQNEPKSKTLEMPFASAPSGSNNNKNILQQQQEKLKDIQPSPVPIMMPRENRVSSAVDNTPPTTPESTISNLSPRSESGGLSPNTADNESCKSNEAEISYANQANKLLSNYSEDDSLLNNELQSGGSGAKKKEDMPSPSKRRRRSLKGDSDLQPRRGRKPNRSRSRQNSDSDDTSEQSMPGNNINHPENDSASTPKPLRYNFVGELDPDLDSQGRINEILRRISEVRKAFTNVKTELAVVEKRRKKLRRKEKEALKRARQEMANI